MESDSLEGETCLSVSRVSVKLLSLQRLCHLDMVYVRHITAAVLPQQEVRLDRQEVSRTLNRMFHSVSQEVEGHVTEEAAEETSSLMFTLYDRCPVAMVTGSSPPVRQSERPARRPLPRLQDPPTWRESLSSFVHTARHRLLPRRPRKRAESETQDRDVSHDASLRADSHDASLRDVSHDASLQDVSHDASLRPPSCSSIALQTDDVTPPQLQASVLMTEVRNLQRDRWLMEQQLQAFRLTVQSEQGILEDRCSDMEVTMETLREHNLRLQRTLSQALNKMEAQHHGDNTPQSANTVTTATTEDTVTMATTEDTVTMATTQRETFTPTSDSERNTEEEEEEEEFLKTEDEWSEEELQTPSPTMHRDASPSQDSPCGEEEGAEPQREGAELQEGEDSCVGEAEDSGTWSPEELLQETVETLKTELQTDRRTERQTGGRKGAELLQAANQVGDSLHWLAVAVTTDTHFGL
ncbi:hypothetical protein EPR50_G00235200 [Perca flavescens]|uniref:Uncharacterized protein n=1 Tax=Perca flavescens TaxID=8167 RepID=A0A484BY73_PERFV|nr:hypothetical protein EPR50_G00235200 [Perca flavescens]